MPNFEIELEEKMKHKYIMGGEWLSYPINEEEDIVKLKELLRKRKDYLKLIKNNPSKLTNEEVNLPEVKEWANKMFMQLNKLINSDEFETTIKLTVEEIRKTDQRLEKKLLLKELHYENIIENTTDYDEGEDIAKFKELLEKRRAHLISIKEDLGKLTKKEKKWLESRFNNLNALLNSEDEIKNKMNKIRKWKEEAYGSAQIVNIDDTFDPKKNKELRGDTENHNHSTISRESGKIGGKRKRRKRKTRRKFRKKRTKRKRGRKKSRRRRRRTRRR